MAINDEITSCIVKRETIISSLSSSDFGTIMADPNPKLIKLIIITAADVTLANSPKASLGYILLKIGRVNIFTKRAII